MLVCTFLGSLSLFFFSSLQLLETTLEANPTRQENKLAISLAMFPAQLFLSEMCTACESDYCPVNGVKYPQHYGHDGCPIVPLFHNNQYQNHFFKLLLEAYTNMTCCLVFMCMTCVGALDGRQSFV